MGEGEANNKKKAKTIAAENCLLQLILENEFITFAKSRE